MPQSSLGQHLSITCSWLIYSNPQLCSCPISLALLPSFYSPLQPENQLPPSAERISPAVPGILGWVSMMKHFWLKEEGKKKKREADLLSPDEKMTQNITDIHGRVGTGTTNTSLPPLWASQTARTWGGM